MLIVFGGPENTTATKCFLFRCFLFLKRLNVARISVCVVFYNVTFLLCFLFRFDVVVFLKCLHIRGFDLLLSELWLWKCDFVVLVLVFLLFCIFGRPYHLAVQTAHLPRPRETTRKTASRSGLWLLKQIQNKAAACFRSVQEVALWSPSLTTASGLFSTEAKSKCTQKIKRAFPKQKPVCRLNAPLLTCSGCYFATTQRMKQNCTGGVNHRCTPVLPEVRSALLAQDSCLLCKKELTAEKHMAVVYIYIHPSIWIWATGAAV